MARRFGQRFLQHFTMAAALLGLLGGCGGDGGGLVAGGGIGGSGVIASGSITARGSIFVNGVEYDTRGARFEREGEDAVVFADDDSALQVGMVVRVEGALDEGGATGQAERIVFDDLVEGPVESVVDISAQVRTAVVLGQTVIVDQGTPGFDNLLPGAVVEVSGFVRPDGSIRATFIRRSAVSADAFLGQENSFEVQGRVSGLAGTTFRIGALTVDFGNVTPRNGTLADGLLVEVKGRELVGAVLTAADIEVKVPGLGVADRARAEVEGLVAGLDPSAATFTLGGQPVDFSAAAFRGGLATDLANGVKVEAEGALAGGILQASEVKFEDIVKLEGNVGTLAQDGNILTLTLQGLSSITVQVEPGVTEIEDVASPADLQAGDHLRIRGRPDASGTGVRATQLRRLGPSSDLTLQGPVGSFDAANQDVVILGVTVNTVGIPDDRFEREDTVIGRNAFYGALAPGILVKAQGVLDQTLTPQWSEIELEE